MEFTPVDLERALVKNTAIWTKDMLFKSPLDRGVTPVSLSIYQGHIPSHQAGPRAHSEHPKVPAMAIKTATGMYRRLDAVITIYFLIVTWDDNPNRRGYIDTHNVINRVIYGLYENVMIDQSFVLTDDPVHFELIDDPAADYHPYYYGRIEAKFGVMTPGPGWDHIGFHTDTGPYNDTGADTLSIVAPEPPPT